MGDARVRAWFTPEHGEALSHRVAKHIGKAQRRVRIASPVLTSGPILATLVEVVNEQRCDVAGIVDETQVDQVFHQWRTNGVSEWKVPLLRRILDGAAFSGKASIPWTPESVHDFMHAKVVVADDTVFAGSFNFSRSGERNAENVLEIRQPRARRPSRRVRRRRARALSEDDSAGLTQPRYDPARCSRGASLPPCSPRSRSPGCRVLVSPSAVEQPTRLSCAGERATIVGSEGDDVLAGTARDDVIVGLEGDDTISGAGGDDLVCGDRGDDTLAGGAGDDGISGGDGDDTIEGGPGTEDAAIFLDAPRAIQASLARGTAGGWGTDLLSGIEDLVGSMRADRLTGNAGRNLLDGRAGNDRLRGGRGTDFLDGDAGADLLDGGLGLDMALYEFSPRAVRADLSRRRAAGWGRDRFGSIEDLRGSRFGDLLVGDRRGNLIAGNGGNDLVAGGGGNDDLRGERGADTIGGGPGRDRLAGGPGKDALDGGPGTDVCRAGELRMSCP